MMYGTVLCLGDSLTFGARCPFGYPELLGQMLTDNMNGTVEWACFNEGISGQTTRQILDRTPGAVSKLNSQAGPKWAVVLAGTNDSKGAGLGLNHWEMLYRQILHWPRRHNIPIAVCTYPTVQPGRMPCYTGKSVRWLRRASEVVRDIAKELDCEPSPVRLVELEDFGADMLSDGVHLTKEGNALLAERVANVLCDSASALDVKKEEAAPRRRLVREMR